MRYDPLDKVIDTACEKAKLVRIRLQGYVMIANGYDIESREHDLLIKSGSIIRPFVSHFENLVIPKDQIEDIEFVMK